MNNSTDRIIFKQELQELLHVSPETIRRWRREGRLPNPDLELSLKTVGWRASTLEQAGIRLVF